MSAADDARPMPSDQWIFGLTMAVLGAAGIYSGRVSSIWQGLDPDSPLSNTIAIATAAVTLLAGIGLLTRRTAFFGAALLLGLGTLWLTLVRFPLIVQKPLSEISYQNFGMTSVIVAAAWMLTIRWIRGSGLPLLSWAFAERGRRGAAVLFAVSLIAFGLSHFFYVEFTAPLVPQWLTHQTFWAYFTGITYSGAGVAILLGIRPRLMAMLATAQMAGFILLIWLPMLIAGGISPFHWTEFVNTVALVVSGWVVACNCAVGKGAQ